MSKTAIRVVDRAQMLAIEQQTFHEFHISEDIIIENVGLESALFLQQKYHLKAGDKAVFICGKGNNAADGLSLARHLHAMGLSIDIYLLFPTNQFSTQAQIQYSRLECLRDKNINFYDNKLTSMPDFQFPMNLMIDCIFGTGLTHELTTEWTALFRFIEKECSINQVPIIALDLPSGSLSDCSSANNDVLHCQLTLMIGAVKIGPLFSEAVSAIGELHTLSAGFPRQLTHSDSLPTLIRTQEKQHQFKAPAQWHKYQRGHVMVVGGNAGLSGAAVLSATAAQRSGAGLITLAHPVLSAQEVAQRLPSDMMLLALDEKNSNRIEEYLPKLSAILIGPGLGRDQNSNQIWNMLMKALSNYSEHLSVIVDADGLFHFSQWIAIGHQLPKNIVWVLTPHLGELKLLLGHISSQWPSNWNSNPQICLKNLAQQLNLNIVLKNAAATTIVNPSGRMLFNYAPCASLATAGSGDILAGMICAQLSLQRQELTKYKDSIIEILSACVSRHNNIGQTISDSGQGAMTILEKLTVAISPDKQ